MPYKLDPSYTIYEYACMRELHDAGFARQPRDSLRSRARPPAWIGVMPAVRLRGGIKNKERYAEVSIRSAYAKFHKERNAEIVNNHPVRADQRNGAIFFDGRVHPLLENGGEYTAHSICPLQYAYSNMPTQYAYSNMPTSKKFFKKSRSQAIPSVFKEGWLRAYVSQNCARRRGGW